MASPHVLPFPGPGSGPPRTQLDIEWMDNDVLINASFEGNQAARAELLIRNIMYSTVDMTRG